MPSSQPQDGSNQLEIDVRLECLVVEPVESVVGVVHEHSVISIEQLFEDKLKIFFFDTSLVDGRLVFKDDSHRFLHLLNGDILSDQ